MNNGIKKLCFLVLFTFSMIHSMENPDQAPQLMKMKRVESLVKNKIKRKNKKEEIVISNKTQFVLVLQWYDRIKMMQKVSPCFEPDNVTSISIKKPILMKITPCARMIRFQDEYEYAHETECIINSDTKSITVTSKGTPCQQNCLKAMLSCNCCDEYSTLQVDTSS